MVSAFVLALTAVVVFWRVAVAVGFVRAFGIVSDDSLHTLGWTRRSLLVTFAAFGPFVPIGAYGVLLRVLNAGRYKEHVTGFVTAAMVELFVKKPAEPEAPKAKDPRVLSLTDVDCPWRGNPKVDGIVWPYNETAPALSDLYGFIEVEFKRGGWHLIPHEGHGLRWPLADCGEGAILARWGGGRRYRVSIRWCGNTLPGSVLCFYCQDAKVPPVPIPGLAWQDDPAFEGPPRTAETATA